jgi:hypothetical protein
MRVGTLSIEGLKQAVAGVVVIVFGVLNILFRDPIIRWNISLNNRIFGTQDPDEDRIEFAKAASVVVGVIVIVIGILIGVGVVEGQP